MSEEPISGAEARLNRLCGYEAGMAAARAVRQSFQGSELRASRRKT
ncbi:MAG: hypothetical protein K0S00_949 [Xanthobacteraceae bacterium]|jgi:hypothetical protein|nr:hypothetical protein [Xanthobacteraceae bacterium]